MLRLNEWIDIVQGTFHDVIYFFHWYPDLVPAMTDDSKFLSNVNRAECELKKFKSVHPISKANDAN